MRDDRKKGGYAPRADGAGQIYYEERGNPAGKPVLFFHGGSANLLETDAFSQGFDADQYRLIFPHRRGLGNSGGSLRSVLYHEQLEDMDSLRTHLGIEDKKFDVFGWSAGATLALLYGQKHPAQVENLYLYGAWMSTDAEFADMFEGFADKNPQGWKNFLKFSKLPPETGTDESSMRKVLENFGKAFEVNPRKGILTFRFLESAAGQTTPEALDKEFQRLPDSKFRGWMSLGRQLRESYGLAAGELAQGMEKLRDHKIVAFFGAQDKVVPVSLARAFLENAACRNVTIETIPAQGHDPHTPVVQRHIRRLTDPS